MKKEDMKQYFFDNIVSYLNDLLLKENSKTGFNPNRRRIEETLYIMREFYDDERYFNKFHESFMNIYNSDRVCSFRNSIFLNRIFHSYFINLFLIMKGYQYHRKNNDYDSFCAVVDDITPVDINDYYLDSSSFDCIKKEFYLSLCEKLVSFNNYKDLNNLRNMVKKVVLFDDDENDLEKMNVLINISKNSNIDSEVVEALLEDNTYYYSDLVVSKDRFFYINKKLKECIENDRIRYDIFMMISSLDKEIFLDKSDRFKKVIDIVFDSDSYDELLKKIIFLGSNKDKSLDSIITSLKSIKSQYMGIDVIYPFDLSFINLPSKPTSIIERMKKAYLNINSSISLDEIDFLYRNSNDLYSFVNQFNHIYKEESKVEEDKEGKIKEKRFWSLFGRVK